MDNYFDRCDQPGIYFMPLVVNTRGGWNEHMAAALTKLAS